MKALLKRLISRHPAVGRLATRMAAGLPDRLRVRPAFVQWLAFFAESEGWSREQHAGYQMTRLQELLAELKRTTPYFTELFAGWNPAGLSSFDEFRARVPAMSRAEYRAALPQLRPAGADLSRYVPSSTSGTTGQALQFHHDRGDESREFAAICHQWRRVGYDPLHSRRAEFRAMVTERGGVLYLPRSNAVRFNIRDFSPAAVRRYADVIRREGIEFLHGYPSALSLLAQAVLEGTSSFPSPRAILLASEMVYAWQLAALERAFPDARIYAHYGCAERVVLAGWCERRRELHCIPEYSLVEVDAENGEVVGTNLFNTVNAFVRYRTTDSAIGAVSCDPCPDCGRAYAPRLGGIGGRIEDYLFSPEHGWIPPAIVTYPLKSLDLIREIQVVQVSREAILVRYRAQTNAGAAQLESEEAGIRHGFLELLGMSVGVRFERVDDFERGPTGKFRWIVSKLERGPDGTGAMPGEAAPPGAAGGAEK